jgi:hypothetical protein
VRGLDAVIAGRPGLAIVPELGEPAIHLEPVRLVEHAWIMWPDLDFHVAPPIEPAASAV